MSLHQLHPREDDVSANESKLDGPWPAPATPWEFRDRPLTSGGVAAAKQAGSVWSTVRVDYVRVRVDSTRNSSAGWLSYAANAGSVRHASRPRPVFSPRRCTGSCNETVFRA